MPRKTTSKKHTAVPPQTIKAPEAAAKVTDKVSKPADKEVSQTKNETVTAEKKTVTTIPAVSPTVRAERTNEATKTESAKNPRIAELVSELRSDAPSARSAAATALGQTANREAVSPLIEALRDVDADVARDAATALGALGDSSAVDSLIEVIENHNNYFHTVVRAAAASSLGQLGGSRSTDALVHAVNDAMAEVSADAIRALGTPGNARAVAPLIDVVRNPNGYFAPIARRAAVLALARIGGEQAIAELHAIASNSLEDAVIRGEAQRSI